MPKSLSGPRPSGQGATISQPRVFISYSWSSPGHQERVRRWAERLLQDGIEVVLDIYDLKEGHDKYSFMERMVTDSEVTHVLVMCDRIYAEKADAKRADVSAESQIISREIHEKVSRAKFIPVACELSEDGEPFLPLFLRSRMWLNFSSPEAANENWEKLLRALYGKPLHRKPAVGAPPAYIGSDESKPANPAIGKLATFKHALLNDLHGVNLYRTEFLSACIGHADALRLRKLPEPDSLAEKIVQDCAELKCIRDLIVDWVLLEGGASSSLEFQDALLDFLESLRGLKSGPKEINSLQDCWFESCSVFVYEAFLYLIAALLKTRAFDTLNAVFTFHYFRPPLELCNNNKFDSFECFYGYSEALQQVLEPHRKRLHSPAAELIRRQADRCDLPFSSIIEAELLVLMMSFVVPDAMWYPQTLYYASQRGFPFFTRATRHRDFLKLATITGISDANVLRQTVKAGFERHQVNSWCDFEQMTNLSWNLMNMDNLDTLK